MRALVALRLPAEPRTSEGVTTAEQVIASAPPGVPGRLATMLLRWAVAEEHLLSASLCIAEDGAWFVRGGAARVALAPLPAKLLAALADAFAEGGGGLSIAALFERGWPGERASAVSIEERVRAVIKRLRRAGLGDLVEANEGDFRITSGGRSSAPAESGGSVSWTMASLVAAAACDRSPAKLVACPFRCTLLEGATATTCPAPAVADVRWVPPSVPSEASEIERITARRASGALTVDVELGGGFVEAVDQNVYLFLGRAADARAGASWALSEDPAFFENLGYEVRSRVTLPGDPLRRVALLSPRVKSYSPQIYESARGQAYVTGAAAPIALQSSGKSFHVSVELATLLGGSAAARDDLWLTVATARDYVGFISEATIGRVTADGTVASSAPTSPSMRYPLLDPDGQKLAGVALARHGPSLDLVVRTVAPVHDWAQTNVNLYFFALPTPMLASRPRDASKAFELPAGWAYYCAIYSPARVFCRRPPLDGWSYDDGYAERARLEVPPGVGVEIAGTEVRVSMDTTVTGVLGHGDVGVVVTVGRDGFGPTTIYGIEDAKGNGASSRGLCHR